MKRLRVLAILIILIAATGCTRQKSLRRALLGMVDRYTARASLANENPGITKIDREEAFQVARLAAALYPNDADAVLPAMIECFKSGRNPYESLKEVQPLDRIPDAVIKLAWLIAAPPGNHPNTGKLEEFAEVNPEIPQARIWLGNKAFDENDFDAALEHFRLAYEANLNHPGARGAYAIALLKTDDWDEAGKLLGDHVLDAERHRTPLSFDDAATLYAHLRFIPPLELLHLHEREITKADFGPDRFMCLATAALRASQPQLAYRILRRAGEEGYENKFPRVLRLVIHFQFLKNLKELRLVTAGLLASRRAINEFPDSAPFRFFHGYFLEYSGMLKEARASYAQAEKLAPLRLATAAARRRLAAREKKYHSGIKQWLEIAPRKFMFAENNRFRKRFENLLKAAEEAENQPSAETISEYGDACMKIGWTEEAIIAYKTALSMNRVHKPAFRELQRARQHQRLIERLTNYMENYYRRARRKSDVPSIEEVLADMEDIARTCVALPQQKENPVYTATFFGSEICPISRPGGALVAYFLNHGQYLEMQQTAGGPVECKLMDLLAILDESCVVGGAEVKYTSWVCGHSLICGSSGQLDEGGHIAGSASYSATGYFVEVESVEPDAKTLEVFKGGRNIHVTPLEKYNAKQFENRKKSSRLAVTKAVQKAFQEGALKHCIGNLSPEFTPEVRERLFTGEYENVADHEVGHLLDFRRLMPAWRHPLRGLWIVISHGFSPTSIAARFETVAELNALACAHYPHVGLSELLGWLKTEDYRPYYIRLLSPDREPIKYSPYHLMARRIFEMLLDYISDNPDVLPELGDREPSLADIPKLTPSAIRDAARKELAGYGIYYAPGE
ncbi:MAG: tetratricopeptide repeat protein [Planctomycetota bacterium]|nr:MAG: tetratricopeptide repeat protein [Planctomycetota bacterium]